MLRFPDCGAIMDAYLGVLEIAIGTIFAVVMSVCCAHNMVLFDGRYGVCRWTIFWCDFVDDAESG